MVSSSKYSWLVVLIVMYRQLSVTTVIANRFRKGPHDKQYIHSCRDACYPATSDGEAILYAAYRVHARWHTLVAVSSGPKRFRTGGRQSWPPRTNRYR